MCRLVIATRGRQISLPCVAKPKIMRIVNDMISMCDTDGDGNTTFVHPARQLANVCRLSRCTCHMFLSTVPFAGRGLQPRRTYACWPHAQQCRCHAADLDQLGGNRELTIMMSMRVPQSQHCNVSMKINCLADVLGSDNGHLQSGDQQGSAGHRARAPVPDLACCA